MSHELAGMERRWVIQRLHLIAVIHRGQKFKETMEAFQQKRVEFIAQEIRNFDAETLYVFLEWIRGNGHKLDRITGMAV